MPSLKAAHRAECTFTADEPCRKGFFGLRAGPAGSTSSRKSRLINRAGILHSVTRSSSWHWSSHKHSYNTPTQQTQRALTYSAGRGEKKKKVTQQGNSRAASSLEGPSSKSSAQVCILGCCSRGVAKGTAHSQSCFPALQHPSARWDFTAQHSDAESKVETLTAGSEGCCETPGQSRLSGTQAAVPQQQGWLGVLWQGCIDT